MKTALVVEDERAERLLFRRWLEPEYEVREAADIAHAITQLDEPSLVLIVLDLRLPNGHGRAVVDALVAKRNDVPVVIVTGHAGDTRPGNVLPITAVLEKPVDRDQFDIAVLHAASVGDSIRSIRESSRKLSRPQL